MIPKILQLHWFWSEWPPFGDEVVERWTAMHPDWDIRLMTEVPDTFPDKWGRFLSEDRIPPANRADLVRNWSMKEYGGIYVDLDTIPLRPIDDELLNIDVWIPICTHLGGSTNHTCGNFIDSCFLGSVPGHPFWDSALEWGEHPEGWPNHTQWFCGSNTFQDSDQYDVQRLEGLCLEVTYEAAYEFAKGNITIPTNNTNEYIVHYRASKAMELIGLEKSHWNDYGTWRSVYGLYPVELDSTIVPRPLEHYTNMVWSDGKQRIVYP